MSNIYDLADTWNDAGTTFTAIKMNVTDTASNAASLLMDLQVGGTSKCKVTKGGVVQAAGLAPVTGTGMTIGSNTVFSGASNLFFDFNCLFGNTSLTTARAYAGNGLGVREGFALGFMATGAGGGNFDTTIYRDAANQISQRNGANAQSYLLYNTYTDASNYERAALRWNSNILELGNFAAGTGTLRGLMLGVSGNSVGFLGATPVAQQSGTGETTGFTAGAGTAVLDDSTFTGNVGSTAYRISDVVKALKNYGLLAA